MIYRLADRSHKLPLAWRGGQLFDAENGEEITDLMMLDPFCRQLIADGSIIPDTRQTEAQDAPAKAPAKRA